MNPEWNTPPHGDFVRYVDRLTAQMALAARQQVAAQAHRIDDGAEPPQLHGHSLPSPGQVVPARSARRKAGARGEAAQPASGDAQQAAVPGARERIFQSLVIGLVTILLVLRLVFDAPAVVLIAVAAGYGFLVFKIRHLLTRAGAEALRQRLERAAAQARKAG